MALKKKKTAAKKKVIRKPAAPKKIVLDTNLRISCAKELKIMLKGFVRRKRVCIDASKPERVDTSTMQLLSAFLIEAEKRSIEVQWESPSPCVLNAAKLLGLTETMKLPSDWE